MLQETECSSLPAVATFLLDCKKSSKYFEPYPLNELAWGPTQAFYDFGMRILNHSGPVIHTWGGKRKLILESAEEMLTQHQLMNAENMELDIRAHVLREESGRKITFTIAPPAAAKFKFLLFGMPMPKQKGQWRLPLLASFLIDCKMAKLYPRESDPPITRAERRRSSIRSMKSLPSVKEVSDETSSGSTNK